MIENWIWLIIILAIWSFIWKGIALWKCGRNNQFGWYVAIFIINTVGILEIVYLYFFQKKASVAAKAPIVKKAKRKR